MSLLDNAVRDQPSLRSLLSVLSDGILATDLNGVRLYSNAALDQLVGHDACEPKASSAPPSFLPKESYDRYLAYIDMMSRGSFQKDCVVLEFPIIDAEEENIDIPVSLIPVINGGNTPVGMLWVFHAPSDTRAHHTRRLEKVLATIAHELDALGYADRRCDEQSVPGLDHLSPREAEVFELLMVGHRVSTMADMLCLSTHTVRNHLKSIFRKTGVHSQAELIRLAHSDSEPSGNGSRSGNGHKK